MSKSKMPESDPEHKNSVKDIFSAARTEFGQNGLSGARIADIAKRCGKTRQLIYHYYESKEDLFAEVVWDSLQTSLSNMLAEDYDSMEPMAAFYRFLYTMSEQYRLHPDFVSIMLEESIQGGLHISSRKKLRAVSQPVIDTLRRIIERGAASGVFRRDIELEKLYAASFAVLSASSLTGGVLSAVLCVDMQSESGMDDWRDYAIEFVMKSVRAPNVEARAMPLRADRTPAEQL